MRVLVVGATGVVGAEVVREALPDPRVSRVVAITRRTLPLSNVRLDTVLHDDFSDFSDVCARLADVDAAICALGMAWPQAQSQAQYRIVTYEYVMALARTLVQARPDARFCFVSGHGASLTSRQTWARIKAETEEGLRETFGARLTVFRPGYIYPVHGRETPYWGDAAMRPFMPFRRALAKYITDSMIVARALLFAALGGTVPSPAGNCEIKAAADAYLESRCNALASLRRKLQGRKSTPELPPSGAAYRPPRKRANIRSYFDRITSQR